MTSPIKSLACLGGALVLALGAAPAFAETITAYTNNFDDPATTAPGVTAVFSGVTYVTTTLGNSYGAWDGDRLFNFQGAGSASVFTLSNLPTHTGISASFILGFLGSWDSTDGDDGQAPDYLDIYLDGSKVAQLTYNNGSGTVKAIGGGTLLAEYDTSFCCEGYPQTVVDMSTASFLTFAHTASTFTLAISASGDGYDGGSAEEWGLDGLRVDLTGTAVPEPASWALLIMGFGGAGAALRRRGRVAA